MADQEPLTPEEIAQVRALLQQRGIDPSVPVRTADGLPPERELGRGRLSWLGTIKRKAVFAWAVGSTIVAILTFPKDCLDIQEFYVPNCQAVVREVAQVIDKLATNPPSEPPSLPPGHQDRYYAFNPEWRALSDTELSSRASGTIPLLPTNSSIPVEPITIIASTTNTTSAIISGSGLVRGLG